MFRLGIKEEVFRTSETVQRIDCGCTFPTSISAFGEIKKQGNTNQDQMEEKNGAANRTNMTHERDDIQNMLDIQHAIMYATDSSIRNRPDGTNKAYLPKQVEWKVTEHKSTVVKHRKCIAVTICCCC